MKPKNNQHVHEIDKATSFLSYVNGLGPIFKMLKNQILFEHNLSKTWLRNFKEIGEIPEKEGTDN